MIVSLMQNYNFQRFSDLQRQVLIRTQYNTIKIIWLWIKIQYVQTVRQFYFWIPRKVVEFVNFSEKSDFYVLFKTCGLLDSPIQLYCKLMINKLKYGTH